MLSKACLRILSEVLLRLLAYEEGLVSLDELRDRMPELRRREKSLSGQIESLDNHLANEGNLPEAG
jgi:hypothetical protein